MLLRSSHIPASLKSLIFLFLLISNVLTLTTAQAQPLKRTAQSETVVCERKTIPRFSIGTNLLHRRPIQTLQGQLPRGFGSAPASKTLQYVHDIGMHGVVLPVPIHAKSRLGATVSPGILGTQEGLGRLQRMIQDAHQEGLFVVLVPHLILDDGEWRGELGMISYGEESPLRRDKVHLSTFFREYNEAIQPIINVAEKNCVEVFSFALELKSLSSIQDTQPHFKALIKKIRKGFSGVLTYSANWDEATDVLFWDELDVISINAFYPLSSSPTDRPFHMDKRARAIQAQLMKLKNKHGRPIWFLEMGYKSTTHTARQPWVWPEALSTETKPDHQAQADAFNAMIQSFYESSAITGVFFWALPSDAAVPLSNHPYEPEYGFGYLGKPSEGLIRKFIANPPKRTQDINIRAR